MNRSQLEHAIRTACQIIGHTEVIVVGSQSILGTYDENRLPAAATMSREVDVLPFGDTNEEIALLADEIEGVAGDLIFEAAGMTVMTSAWLMIQPPGTGSNFDLIAQRFGDRISVVRVTNNPGQRELIIDLAQQVHDLALG